jgi:hypothetical protein
LHQVPLYPDGFVRISGMRQKINAFSHPILGSEQFDETVRIPGNPLRAGRGREGRAVFQVREIESGLATEIKKGQAEIFTRT